MISILSHYCDMSLCYTTNKDKQWIILRSIFLGLKIKLYEIKRKNDQNQITHWYNNTTIFSKCSFSYIWVAIDSFSAFKAVSHKGGCIATNDSEKNHQHHANPTSFFHCVRCWENANSSHHISCCSLTDKGEKHHHLVKWPGSNNNLVKTEEVQLLYFQTGHYFYFHNKDIYRI